MMTNHLESVNSSHYQSKEVLKSVDLSIKVIKKERKKVDDQLDKLLKQWEPGIYRLFQV